MAYALATPTTVAQNTAATNDLGADGYTWAQGRPLEVDEYGKLIAWVQKYNAGGPNHTMVVSNDNGATWSEPSHTGFGPTNNSAEWLLGRAAQAYDATNHLLHVCWVLTQANGAVIYRQYSFTRDGSNNITGVTRVRGLQMEVGVSGMAFDFPVALWCADVGKLLLGWTAGNGSAAGTTKAEVRLTMRTVSNSAADVDIANWVAPLNENTGAGSTDTLGSTGLGKYSCIVKTVNSGNPPCLALFRKPATAATHAKDLVFAYTAGPNSGSVFFNRATWASGTSDWRTGLAAALANDAGLTTITGISRAGTDTGYSLKYQVLAKLAYDPVADALWGWCSTWKDNTAGDTASIFAISAADAATLTDVYAAGSANTDAGRDMFVTGDVMYDATSGYLVVTYTDLPRHDVYLATYASGALVQSGFAAYTATPCDIPTIYDARIGGLLALLFRDFNAGARSNPATYTPPYAGYYVTVALALVPTTVVPTLSNPAGLQLRVWS